MHATPLPAAATFTVSNPATGEPLASLPIFDAAQVRAEMARVRRAQPAWAALPIQERGRRLESVAQVIGKKIDHLMAVVSRENGKPLAEALALDVGPTLLTMNYFIRNAPRILAPEPLRLAIARHRKSYLSFQPKGVIGVITPWNFPFYMPGSDVSMALLAGNGVLLKPSEVTPLSALALKECYDEAGIDPELFRVVTGLGPTGASIIEADPDHLVFTGSVPVGRKVGVACAERMISYTLELGGKAPALVLEDADLERTSNAIVWGGFANGGQICASIERVYALPGVYEPLLERVTQKASQLRVGPGEGGDVEVGAMTWAKQREIVERLVEDARVKGARITTGGERYGNRGNFYRPTVVADCTHEMELMKAEIFGPVVPLMKVKDEAEALRLANTSHLGLGAYVFTENVARGRQLAEQLQVGSVMINDVLTHAGAPEMPWGGIKHSGLGVVRSDRGLRELCHARHINADRLPQLKQDPYWFPYSTARTEQIKGLLRRLYAEGPVGAALRRLLS